MGTHFLDSSQCVFTVLISSYSGDGLDPYFECFMLSDLFQALHKHRLLFEKESKKDYFDLITAKNDRDSASPTFLRQGTETDIFYFR